MEFWIVESLNNLKWCHPFLKGEQGIRRRKRKRNNKGTIIHNGSERERRGRLTAFDLWARRERVTIYQGSGGTYYKLNRLLVVWGFGVPQNCNS